MITQIDRLEQVTGSSCNKNYTYSTYKNVQNLIQKNINKWSLIWHIQ